MAKEDTEYEKFVRDICQLLLNADGLETVEAQHNVLLKDRTGGEHQVDVYWEYRRAGVTHRVAIECKNYKSAVNKGVVRAMIGLTTVVNHLQGVVVTTVGFQSGAIELAQDNGIGLRVIRPPKDEDWKGKVRRIDVTSVIEQPKLLGFSIELDIPWGNQHLTSEQRRLVGAEEGKVLSRDSPHLFTDNMVGGPPIQLWQHLNRLFNSLRLNHLAAAEEDVQVFGYEDAYITYPALPPVKITSFTIRYARHAHPAETFSMEAQVQAIVRDAIDGRLQFIDPEGHVSGDGG
ncbi:restriction endonuclease [Deinococcus soli (ex Cha et al. 2016)]|uniref:Restriction endonuclease type IV Mrr domain-containing protein n=2 Tax=Deinococcus soli (ex Cha et al. 2016) TaxID=1309411 RepID=A0AAE3XE80_9DEIO|nr:restriction endonuclease [Deinococcus soli (ex Cha et al. 2016)]MDR6219218.1 hypothetical protein [Deinococcus soli (ex Cha et al. 2016)]MDR6329467.1 hypothetical protein [Deinococcus soli (ex Cha et al. 2016)]MDR6752127.1 hypothetical protein [Deinococcus soli (ex Cha et al. 2016)]